MQKVVSERCQTESNRLTDNVHRYAVDYIKKMTRILQWEIYIVTPANKDNGYKLEPYSSAHIAPLTDITL